MMYTVCARTRGRREVNFNYKDGIINYCCTYVYTTAPPQVAFTIIILY